MGKYEIVEKLLYSKLYEIKSSKEKWIEFLHTASNR